MNDLMQGILMAMQTKSLSVDNPDLQGFGMRKDPRPENKRVIYFHTGTPKTGSSALQSYFAMNEANLGNEGFGYANLETSHLSLYNGSEFIPSDYQFAGNGEPFFKLLYGRSLQQERLEEIIEFYLCGKHVALCSSENFFWFGKSEWLQIRDACQRMGVLVKTITVLRNIGGFYYSGYGQQLKNGEVLCSFEDYCSCDEYFRVFDSLRSQLDVLSIDSMNVIHYESSAMQLDTAFMAIFGLPREFFDRTPLQKIINRSLAQYEQSILLKVSNSTGQQYARELSHILIKNRPNIKVDNSIEPHIVAQLERRHEVDLQWVNTTFFEGKNVLKIQDKLSKSKSGSALNLVDKQGIDQDVANWAVSKLQMAQDASMDYVSSCLRAIDWENAGNSAIPTDFDPIAYLLLNPDLLRAAAQPYKHFIVSGQHEHGRKWKWSTL